MISDAGNSCPLVITTWMIYVKNLFYLATIVFGLEELNEDITGMGVTLLPLQNEPGASPLRLFRVQGTEEPGCQTPTVPY